jgi:hypothetical protein
MIIDHGVKTSELAAFIENIGRKKERDAPARHALLNPPYGARASLPAKVAGKDACAPEFASNKWMLSAFTDFD